MMETPSFLREAVEDVYRAFKDVPRGKFEHCSCGCVRDEYRIPVTTLPMRKVDRSAMSFFAFKAMTTWGDAQALKHYLPRIIELCDPSWPGLAPTMIAKKLELAKWSTWPDRLREPVSRWIDARFDAAAAGLCGEGAAEDTLAMAVMLGKNLNALLERWSSDASRGALQERIRYVFAHEGVFSTGAFSTSAFEALHEDPHVVTTLRDWLLSEGTREALLRAESLGLVGADNYVPELAFWWPERIR